MNQIKVNWDKIGGLLPVTVQDCFTKEVLMLAYMNDEALKLTLESGFAHYFSRTKGRIWKKGESSTNVQKLISCALDCDCDALLIVVEQVGGVACHTGSKSCFFNTLSLDERLQNKITPANVTPKKPDYGILDDLYHTILQRKLNIDDTNSYVAKLLKGGENSYLKKIAEEAGEFIMAAKDLQRSEKYENFQLENFGEHRENDPKYDLVYEGADLLFHMILTLCAHDIHPQTLLDELVRREGNSGITEKANRKS